MQTQLLMHKLFGIDWIPLHWYWHSSTKKIVWSWTGTKPAWTVTLVSSQKSLRHVSINYFTIKRNRKLSCTLSESKPEWLLCTSSCSAVLVNQPCLPTVTDRLSAGQQECVARPWPTQSLSLQCSLFLSLSAPPALSHVHSFKMVPHTHFAAFSSVCRETMLLRPHTWQPSLPQQDQVWRGTVSGRSAGCILLVSERSHALPFCVPPARVRKCSFTQRRS